MIEFLIAAGGKIGNQIRTFVQPSTQSWKPVTKKAGFRKIYSVPESLPNRQILRDFWK
jgi:hypothetical protein